MSCFLLLSKCMGYMCKHLNGGKSILGTQFRLQIISFIRNISAVSITCLGLHITPTQYKTPVNSIADKSFAFLFYNIFSSSGVSRFFCVILFTFPLIFNV